MAADTSEMEEKLQALFQTMVAEHAVESTQEQEQERDIGNTTTLVVTTDGDGNLITHQHDGVHDDSGEDNEEEVIIQQGNGTIVRFASQAVENGIDVAIDDNEEGGGQQITITSQHMNNDQTDITAYEEVGEIQQGGKDVL